MGSNFYSYAIIGIEVDIQKLYAKQVVRACNCEVKYDYQNLPKFCEKCGSPWLEESVERIEGFDGTSLFDFRVIFNTDKEKAVVGWATTIADNYPESNVAFTQLPSINLVEKKEELKNVLGPQLWDEKKFGLYSVIYCPY